MSATFSLTTTQRRFLFVCLFALLAFVPWWGGEHPPRNAESHNNVLENEVSHVNVFNRLVPTATTPASFSANHSTKCERLHLRASRTRHALYCPFSVNMGLTNQMMMFAQCVLSAWRYAGGADVYFEHKLQLGTIYDVYNIAAFAKFVKHTLGVTVRVACPPANHSLDGIDFVPWFRNMKFHKRYLPTTPYRLWMVPNGFAVGFFSRVVVLPFVDFVVQHPSPTVTRLANNMIMSRGFPFDFGVHARIEKEDAFALLGVRRMRKGVRGFNSTLAAYLLPHSSLAASSTSVMVYVTGQRARKYQPFSWAVPVCKDNFTSPSDVTRYLSGVTHYNQDSKTKTTADWGPCPLKRPMPPLCASLTNTTAAMVDFIVLSKVKRALSAHFSSFGYMLNALRCATNRTTLMYDKLFNLMINTTCRDVEPYTLDLNPLLRNISRWELYDPTARRMPARKVAFPNMNSFKK
eukprot:PhM_4_TR12955/c0_g1_i1/m.60127